MGIFITNPQSKVHYAATQDLQVYLPLQTSYSFGVVFLTLKLNIPAFEPIER